MFPTGHPFCKFCWQEICFRGHEDGDWAYLPVIHRLARIPYSWPEKVSKGLTHPELYWKPILRVFLSHWRHPVKKSLLFTIQGAKMCQTSIHADDFTSAVFKTHLVAACWLVDRGTLIVPNTLAGKTARNLQTTAGFEHHWFDIDSI